ncbi:23S rRNA (uracil(1939)-C(5))-methyltransferase RlmD [Tissierella sp. Yu-01]|uniref:23S rRNA (uracil(1939)-C(5))-methyltransferase RlmD n=1 Tax=Tissierella sp. Yu-01 TaxID=3035694 RepID=UPI00240DAF59|nr:23S rRNA (uracil(1939)-C(5))-methyltransferase RlmD [Tissierella sp. Yu-01]WFA08053.1 23S rRNA (uracil(1939)-C(5))-methyltransferase RlmD [Tissierella sp. Yu-01]
MVKKNEIIEFVIDKVEFPNKGKASYEGNLVKFKGGIEGQRVSAKISRKRRGTIEAKIIEVIEKSPLEAEPRCKHFGICGGCSYQTLSYQDELKLKESQVRELFEREELDINLLGIEPSPIEGTYRNKMEYTFGDEEKGGPLSLGLHMKGRFYETVNTSDCNIVDNDFTLIRESVRKYFEEKNMPFYNTRQHQGVLRHLVIRKALSSGEVLVNLVTSSQQEINIEEFKETLIDLKINGEIKGILHTINDGLSDVVKADRLDLLYGRDYIIEEILGLKFKISPFSFFQTNSLGAEKLYSIAREFAGDIDDKVVFDLYSGTGTIAQIMAPVAKKVIGIEIIEEAVEMANENAKLNKLDNVEFIAGDVLKAVDDLKEKPDLIVIDPPRDGIHPKAINKIIDFSPDTFVYVSCNPVTLARDLKVFIERGYKVEKAKLMDMFPRTPHVEVVTRIVKE